MAMQWSMLKSRIRRFICPELRKRIDFHVTSYRRSHDEAEKAWITLDGKRVMTFSWYQHQWAQFQRSRHSVLAWERIATKEEVERRELHIPQQFGDALCSYLTLSIKEALRHTDPFVRALAVIDRRVGQRTLKSLKIGRQEHSLVKTFYALRLEVLGQTNAKVIKDS